RARRTAPRSPPLHSKLSKPRRAQRRSRHRAWAWSARFCAAGSELTGTRESNMARILVIENNENNRVLLSRRLKSRCFEVLTAGDAESGLAMVAAERPNVVLMDIGLP